MEVPHQPEAVPVAKLVGSALVVFVVCVSAFFLLIVLSPKPDVLPDDVKTLAQFQQRMPDPKVVWYAEHGGAKTFVVEAHTTPASGPAVYVFDEKGTLTSWCIDIEDLPDQPAAFAYQMARRDKSVTLAEAIKLAQEANK
jgi:hypothetical protein